MGQHSGRIHIRVKEPKDWLKLKGAPVGLLNAAIRFFYGISYNSLDEISASNKIDIELSGEGEVGFGDISMGRGNDKVFDPSRVCDMCSVVKALAELLGESAVIIADSTYNGGDPCTSCVYYLGEKTRYEYFGCGKKARMREIVGVSNILEWLKAGGFKLTDAEKNHLSQFGLGTDQSSKRAKLIIPTGTTSIEDSAFSGCMEITDIVIPNSVKDIGKLAFYGCTGLSRITIPESVTSIGKSAFNGCRGLKEVTISENVLSIGEMAFYSCTKLDSIIFKGTMEKWNSVSLGRAWKGMISAKEVICTDGIVSLK